MTFEYRFELNGFHFPTRIRILSGFRGDLIARSFPSFCSISPLPWESVPHWNLKLQKISSMTSLLTSAYCTKFKVWTLFQWSKMWRKERKSGNRWNVEEIAIGIIFVLLESRNISKKISFIQSLWFTSNKMRSFSSFIKTINDF